MRRFLPYAALLTVAVLAGGCAFTDYPGTPTGRLQALKDLNLSHQALSCDTADKMPGENTQQNWERGVLNFSRVEQPGTGACNTTYIGKVSAEEAKEWERFIGPLAAFNGYIVSGYGNCYDGAYIFAGVKGLEDGSVRIHSYRYAANSPGYPGPWSMLELPPENGIMGDEIKGLVAPSPYNTQWPTGIWAISIDTDPGRYGWWNNFVAFNDDETSTNRCDFCLSTAAGNSARVTEGQFFNAALKGAAGLAEFFNGEPMPVNWKGYTVTMSGHVANDGVITLSFHSFDRDGSVYTATNPIQVNYDPQRRLWHYKATHDGGLVGLAQWALQNVDMSKGMELGGFVPELGITIPDRAIKLNEVAIRHFIQTQTSGIEPRRREGGR